MQQLLYQVDVRHQHPPAAVPRQAQRIERLPAELRHVEGLHAKAEGQVQGNTGKISAEKTSQPIPVAVYSGCAPWLSPFWILGRQQVEVHVPLVAYDLRTAATSVQCKLLTELKSSVWSRPCVQHTLPQVKQRTGIIIGLTEGQPGQ